MLLRMAKRLRPNEVLIRHTSGIEKRTTFTAVGTIYGDEWEVIATGDAVAVVQPDTDSKAGDSANEGAE